MPTKDENLDPAAGDPGAAGASPNGPQAEADAEGQAAPGAMDILVLDESPPQRKPDAGAAADAEPAPEVAGPPKWEAETWALAHGIDEATRAQIRACKSEAEALEVLAGRHRDLTSLVGRQGQELGDLRQRAKAATPSDAGARGTAEQQQAALATLTEQQLAEYQDAHDRNPLAAERWLYRTFILPEVMPDILAAVRAERQAERAEDEKKAAQRDADEEMRELVKKHADAADRRAEMQGVSEVLAERGIGLPPYEVLYDLAVLAKDDPARYRGVVELMGEGMSMPKAVEFVDLRAERADRAAGAADRATKVVDKANAASSAPGGPQPVPALRLGRRGLRDAPDDVVRALTE